MSIVRYDVFAYGTAYLISSTKSNDPGGGFFGAFPGEHHDLRSPLRLASDGTNEQKLLKIDYRYEDRRQPKRVYGQAVVSTTSVTIVWLWTRSRSTKLGQQLKFNEAAQLPRTQVRIVHGGHHGGGIYKVL